MRRIQSSALALWLCLPGIHACDLNPPIDRARLILDQSIAQLRQESGSWQRTLVDAQQRLTRDARGLLTNEITQLMQRTIATAGVELRCNVDFIGQRVLEGLESIRDGLLGHAPQPPHAYICQVSPTAVNMEARPASLEFYGFNFDAPDVHVTLVSDSGTVSLDPWLRRPSHYLWTLDVSPTSPIPLCNRENRRIELRQRGALVSSVSVVRAACPEPPAPPAPAPPQTVHVQTLRIAGGLFGASENSTFGRRCSAGFHRLECTATRVRGMDADGHCEPLGAGWTNPNDPADCTCSVHFGVPALRGIECEVVIREVGEQPPAPPAPPCACW